MIVGLMIPGLKTKDSGDEDASVSELVVETGELFNGGGESFVARCLHLAFAVFSADLVWFRRMRSNSSLYSHV